MRAVGFYKNSMRYPELAYGNSHGGAVIYAHLWKGQIMFSIVEYTAPERLTSTFSGRRVIKGQIRTYDDAVAEVKRMLVGDKWKVTGFNEELDYFWGREVSPSRRRRILRTEQ